NTPGTLDSGAKKVPEIFSLSTGISIRSLWVAISRHPYIFANMPNFFISSLKKNRRIGRGANVFSKYLKRRCTNGRQPGGLLKSLHGGDLRRTCAAGAP